ncbi:MAG: pentapeptide repeat-containing protein [Armatimonadota bacterium]|nr:pentapeptide repeat-containing protein [Armatimonadota bacterium]
MVEIRHRVTGDVLLRVPAETLAGADLAGVNLAGANLSGERGWRPSEVLFALLTLGLVVFSLLAGEFQPHLLLAAFGVIAALFRGKPGMDLTGANLRDAVLIGADLRRTVLANADLRGACLVGADMAGANVRGARYDLTTQWPIGWNPLRAGAVMEQYGDHPSH